MDLFQKIAKFSGCETAFLMLFFKIYNNLKGKPHSVVLKKGVNNPI